MNLINSIVLLAILSVPCVKADEWLVKVNPNLRIQFNESVSKNTDLNVEEISPEWVKLSKNTKSLGATDILRISGVEFIQPNFKIAIEQPWQIKEVDLKNKVTTEYGDILTPTVTDNPDFKPAPAEQKGSDPLLNKQWGINDIGAPEAWRRGITSGQMIVAVIDTGVDYNHEDLIANIWRNPGEQGLDASGRNKATNGIDDDQNGFIDDVAGWDFVSNDNKPYDLYEANPINLVTKGGNPGHGTHCAGNVGARGENAKGISGVAPNVKIMPLRFIGEKGEGSTDTAVKAIRYAVDNGAKVLSNSWGSLGEDPKDDVNNKALRDAIQYAMDKGVLFIAAAGNGNQMGVGFDNDTSSTPAFPASYPHENIISVAAIDVGDKLGSFSNWGKNSVDIGAPGVKVFSTVAQPTKYSDVVLDLFGFMTVNWDGTSMACPHVAGAAALYWSQHPLSTWQEVKAALLKSATPIPALQGKVVSNGKLSLKSLMDSTY